MIAAKNNPPPDDVVRARMQGLRGEIDRDLEDVSARGCSMVEWKHYGKAFPWICLGTVAAIGFVIAAKRPTATNADLATTTEPTKTGRPVASKAPTAAHRFLDALAVAAVSVAVREAIACIGQSAGRLLGIDGES